MPSPGVAATLPTYRVDRRGVISSTHWPPRVQTHLGLAADGRLPMHALLAAIRTLPSAASRQRFRLLFVGLPDDPMGCEGSTEWGCLNFHFTPVFALPVGTR